MTYVSDVDTRRIDRDWVWRMLCTEAYLADVIVHAAHRGRGVGKLLIRTMIDDGPGAQFRWTLFTDDAHGLYEQFGFAAPDRTAMVRPSTR